MVTRVEGKILVLSKRFPVSFKRNKLIRHIKLQIQENRTGRTEIHGNHNSLLSAVSHITEPMHTIRLDPNNEIINVSEIQTNIKIPCEMPVKSGKIDIGNLDSTTETHCDAAIHHMHGSPELNNFGVEHEFKQQEQHMSDANTVFANELKNDKLKLVSA